MLVREKRSICETAVDVHDSTVTSVSSVLQHSVTADGRDHD